MMQSREEEIGHVMKGRRTKRQRLQSFLPFSISSSQSEEAFLEDHDNGGLNAFSSSYSLDQIQTSADEDDEQDMAHCLILLAQGGRTRESPAPIYSPAPATSPVSFRATGKMGRSCDYECKTCGRTFHSFQALGGHRASHKKPRAVSAIEDAKKELQLSFEEGGGGEFKSRFSHPLSLSLNPRTQSGNNKSNKTHECSICGAEFSSGQALGGHMRRHRAPLMAASSSSSLCLNPLMEDSKGEEQPKKRKRNGISLDLDLNLPAQPDDHDDLREPKLTTGFINSNRQQHVFSSPALVDCHY